MTRLDADGEEENNNNKKGGKGGKGGKKSTGLGTRLPYGLCNDLGIDTTGMTPTEAWDAYYGKTGVKPKDAMDKKIKSGADRINPNDPDGQKQEEEEKTESEVIPETQKEEGEKSQETAQENPVNSNEQEINEINDFFQNKYGISPQDPVWNDFDKYCKPSDLYWVLDRYHAMAGGYVDADEHKELMDKFKRAKELGIGARQMAGETGEKSAQELRAEYVQSIHDWQNSEKELESKKDFGSSIKSLVLERKENDLMRKYTDARTKESAEKLKKRREEYESLSDEEKEAYDDRREKEIEQRKKEIKDATFKIASAPESKPDDEVSWNDYYWENNELDTELDDIKEHRREREKAKREKMKAEREARGESSSYGEEIEHNYRSDTLKQYSAIAPKSKVDTTVPTLSNWSSKADDVMDLNVNDVYDQNTGEVVGIGVFGLTPERMVEAQKNLNYIFDNSEFCMNVNSGNVENMIMDHVKNQMEAHKSDGYYSPGTRRKVSDDLFGSGTDLDDNEYEKYGYIADKGDFDGTLGGNAPHYGGRGSGSRCCLTFKKDQLKNRTTYTMEDSLDYRGYRSTAGVVDENCSLEGLSYCEDVADGLANGDYTSIADLRDAGCMNYVEAQYHGDVGAKEIESVRFSRPIDMIETIEYWGDDVWNKMRENDIKLGYFDGNDELKLMDVDEAHDFMSQFR